jgi:hypothetical protein
MSQCHHLLLYIICSFVAPHAHSIQVLRNYKEFPLEPQLDKGKWPTIFVNFDSSESSLYTIKTLLVKPEDNERKICFDDMHREMLRV